MAIKQTALEFFDACETGKGWDVCQQWCTPDATFSAQADALTGIDTLEGYVEWMKGLLVPIPNGRYELMGFAVDEDRATAIGAAVFHGTHTVDPENGNPTGKSAAADYCYVMKFDGDRISNMTKIWNDGITLRELGWA